jgi:hypothetical protein
MAEQGPSLRVRMNLAGPHLFAAARFCRQVRQIETRHTGDPLGNFFDEILSYSIACVLTTVAGLEAYINEVFIDHPKYFPDLQTHVMNELWKRLERQEIMEKYQVALNLLYRPAIEAGSEPYQSVLLLIRLRNALVHFKPEWPDEQVAHSKLSDSLARKFTPSPYFHTSEPVFPRRWATYDCNRWAVESTLDFVRRFEALAGFENRFDAFAHLLAV